MKRCLTVFLVLLLALVSSAVPVAARSTGDGTVTKGWWAANLASGTFEGVQLVNGSLTLDPTALLSGTDTTGRYNGGAYFYGRFTAPVQNAVFTEAIPSWLAGTQPGTWIEVELRAQVDGLWTKWYSLGVWLEQDSPMRRHSVGGQGDKTGTVATDTLVLSKPANALQARVTLFADTLGATPAVRALGLTYSNDTDKPGLVPPVGLVSDLAVPKRSQMVYPDGGEVWCSPTSTSMVLAYWGFDQTVPTVVKGVWDYRYNGGGNWPFNTAYAGALGLEGRIVRLSSLAEVERWTAAGVPVIASIAFKKGGLTGAPISATAGHLVVVRGFDAAGNVLVNDPAAATDEEVALTYDRVEFEAAWLGNSNGVAYLIYPAGWAIPATNGHW